MDWTKLGTVEPKTLAPSRVVLHWAAQLPSAVGATLGPPKEDSSHTALTWNSGTLVCQDAALRLADLTLLARGAEMPLGDKTLADALAWLGEKFGKKMERPVHELPEHPIGKGAAFPGAARAAYGELAHWFANASLVLEAVRASRKGASPVRCWPHHFDIATLITIDDKRSIGVGLSPGDATYAEPYLYVAPWPYPERSTLPALANASWHIAGWTGAVLSAASIVASADQHQTVTSFVETAIDACFELLGPSVH
jgi:hypothetical protein